MSQPFCIWTTQRTGGTTLFSVLSSMSPYPLIQDEPFLIDRVLGCVYSEYWKIGAKVFDDISPMFFDKRGVIKHCFSGALKLDFEIDLHNFLSSKGYKHIYLFRENRVNEYLSLALAKASDVWSYMHTGKYQNKGTFKVELKPLGVKIKRLEINKQRVQSEILNRGDGYFKVSYEELYDKPIDESKWRELFVFLGHDQNSIDLKENELPLILGKTNQKSKDYYSKVENFQAVIALITNLVK